MTFKIIITMLHMLYVTRSEWVNPHDMNRKVDLNNYVNPHDMNPTNDDYYNYVNEPKIHSYTNYEPDTNHNKENPIAMEAYFKRTINMLLKLMQKSNMDENLYTGFIYLKLNADDYQYLMSLASRPMDKNDLTKIDRILSVVFSKPIHKDVQYYLETWFHKFMNLLLSREGISTVIVCAYAFVLYKLFRANFYTWYMLSFLFINFLIFDFIFTWMQLYKNAQIENIMDQQKYQNIPIHCKPNEMSSWQLFLNYFRRDENECKKYHEFLYRDIFWTISPSDVILEMIKHVLLYLGKPIGEAFGDLCTGMFNAFPWPLNIIMFPLIFIFFCLLICIVLSFTLRVPIKLNLFHMISLSFATDSKRSVNDGDMVSGKNVDRLLGLAAARDLRQIIEELPITNADLNSSSKTNKKKRKGEEIKHVAIKTICDDSKGKQIKLKPSDNNGDDNKK